MHSVEQIRKPDILWCWNATKIITRWRMRDSHHKVTAVGTHKGDIFLYSYTIQIISSISRKQILVLLLGQFLETRGFCFLNTSFSCTKKTKSQIGCRHSEDMIFFLSVTHEYTQGRTVGAVVNVMKWPHTTWNFKVKSIFPTINPHYSPPNKTSKIFKKKKNFTKVKITLNLNDKQQHFFKYLKRISKEKKIPEDGLQLDP